MLDLGWSELLMIAVITVIVVGPRELPRVLRTVTQGMKKIRSIASEFQSGIDDMAREADLQDLKKQLEKGNLEDTITDTVDPTGEMTSVLKETKDDLNKQKSDLSDASKTVEASAKDAMEPEDRTGGPLPGTAGPGLQPAKTAAETAEEAPAAETASPPAPEKTADTAEKDKKVAGGET